MPSGVVVKTNHFVAVTDYDHALMIAVDVSGTMGTAIGNRVFLPANFFEANEKPLFAYDKRENAVDLRFPHMVTDAVTLRLPAGFTIESVPKSTHIQLSNSAEYVANYKGADLAYTYDRRMIVASVFYDQKEYPELRDFYAKANAQDQQQALLHYQ